jgi:FMN phosphatase YigB (HAD superfamily)
LSAPVAGSAGGGVRACLVDVYSTLLRYDFAAHSRRLAELAGADIAAWQRGQAALNSAFDCGRLSGTEVFGCLLECCGIHPRPGQADELARANREYLRDGCGLFSDSVPFLRQLRAAGLTIALVSNCGADTRPVLTDLGVIPLADHAILSCEIGYAKPGPEIYAHALKTLGVPPADAVMIDDQPSYCEGAEALGIRAIQIARDGTPPDPRFTPVDGLLAIPSLL